MTAQNAALEKFLRGRRRVFFSDPQVIDASLESCHRYDEIASGFAIYAYVGNDPLNAVDPSGLWTFQLGVAASINLPLGLTIPFGGGLAIDTQLNVATYGYLGGGLQVGAEVEAGMSLQVSNAKTIGDLTGPFNYNSAHAGAGYGGSLDLFYGPSEHGPVVGGGVTIGAAAGASISTGVTTTCISGYGCGETPSVAAAQASPALLTSPDTLAPSSALASSSTSSK
jgi:hypothetical protein